MRATVLGLFVTRDAGFRNRGDARFSSVVGMAAENRSVAEPDSRPTSGGADVEAVEVSREELAKEADQFLDLSGADIEKSSAEEEL